MDGFFGGGLPQVLRWTLCCLLCLLAPRCAVAQQTSASTPQPLPTAAKPLEAEAEPAPAAASSDPVADDDDEDLSNVSEAVIKGRIQRVQDNADLEPEERDSLIEDYKRALDALAKAQESRQQLAKLEKLARSEPADLKAARDQLESTRPSVQQVVDAGLSLEALEEGLALAEERLADWKQKQEEADSEADRRSARRQEIPNEQINARDELESINRQLERGPDADESEARAEASEMLLRARRFEIIAELELLHQEQLTYRMTADLMTARSDLAAVEVGYAESLVAAWEEKVNAQRRTEVDSQVLEAERLVGQVPAALRSIAERNAEVTRLRRDLAQKIESAQSRSEAVDAQSAELAEEFEKISARAKRAGFTETVAVVLRRRRESLPGVVELKQQSREREHETAQLGLQLAELEEQRTHLADLGSAVARRTKALNAPAAASTGEFDVELLRSLLKAQRDYLDDLIGDTSRYLESLMELETAERQLLRQTQDYARFCDEHVLWIRSTVPPQAADGPRLLQAVADFLQFSFWGRIAGGIARDFRQNFALYLGVAAAAVVVFLLSRTRQGQLRAESARGGSDSSRCRLALTIVWTGAATVPLVLWFLGLRVAMLGLDDLTAAAGRGLQSAALLLAPLRIVRMGTRLNSLDPTLLAWPADRVLAWRRVARILSWWGVPLMFLTLWGAHLAGDLVRNALGRVAFVALQGLLWWSLRRLDPHRTPPEAKDPSQSQSNWRRSVGGVWPVVAVAVPLSFALLSIWGYHYTAVQLELRLLGMLGLWGALSIIERLTSGWVLPRFAAPAMDSPVVGKPGPKGSDPVDALPAVESGTAQLRHLLRMAMFGVFVLGCWRIWGEVLPALQVLQAIELWPHPFRILESTDPEEIGGLVTIAGVALAILIGLFTWFCERTLPELLDVTVLSRTQLDAGGRYAVAAVSRYTVIVLGVLATFSQLGIGWSQLNWLVAAMTVGLGFGLQEIFANFVSGLILLFERPVRIGDIVSIGDITGTVTRIRMRATTITDGELRELIVPNKELITGRVINWTLTNTLSRLTLKIRVATGTDPDFARGLLLGVAAKHRLVLKQPPPAAQFEEFADNALSFSLRVCVASCDVSSQVRHELLTMIKREFQEAGIATTIPPASPKPAATPVNSGVPSSAPAPAAEHPGGADASRGEPPRSGDALPRPHVPIKSA